MECKNCSTTLLETNRFCPNCSAKVINNKLTFSFVVEEFLATYINWDNKFFKTFLHLFTKPEVVVNSYLGGIRKRYMQPFAFMIVALTIYGFYMFFSKDEVLGYIDSINASSNNDNNKEAVLSEKWTNSLINYHNIITFGSIPFLAVLNLLIFKTRNFIEHCILLVYVYTNYILGSTIIGALGLLFNVNFTYVYLLNMILMVVYHMYAYQKIFELSYFKIILKTILLWLSLTLIFTVFVIFQGIASLY